MTSIAIIWLSAFMLLWLPGVALQRLLRVPVHADWLVALALQIGLGMAWWPLLLLWSTTLGLAWSPPVARAGDPCAVPRRRSRAPVGFTPGLAAPHAQPCAPGDLLDRVELRGSPGDRHAPAPNPQPCAARLGGFRPPRRPRAADRGAGTAPCHVRPLCARRRADLPLGLSRCRRLVGLAAGDDRCLRHRRPGAAGRTDL